MSELQYVGARYVPKFAEPLEWNKTRSYEALTIVTYNNDSYTSKIPVPPGTEITDGKYWVATARFNSQVEQYRQETERVSEENQTIKEDLANYETEVGDLSPIVRGIIKKKVVFIGDSLGGDRSESWIDECVKAMPLNSDQYYKSAKGGAGFTVAKNTFEMLLDDAIAHVANKTEVTDVIAGGGYNDSSTALNETLKNAFNSFWVKARTNFPNAKLTWCNLGWSSDFNRNKNLFNTIYPYYRQNPLNIACLDFYNPLCCGNYSYGDGLHYNASGAQLVGSRIAHYLQNGIFDNSVTIQTTLTPFKESNGNHFYVTLTPYIVTFSAMDGGTLYLTETETDKWNVTPQENLIGSVGDYREFVSGIVNHAPLIMVGFGGTSNTLKDATSLVIVCLQGNLFCTAAKNLSITNLQVSIAPMGTYGLLAYSNPK